MQEQCSRLENLLKDFLRFAKLQHLELTPGDLNEQVDRVLNLFAAQADEAGVEIVRYLDPGLPSMMINAETLQAALGESGEERPGVHAGRRPTGRRSRTPRRAASPWT